MVADMMDGMRSDPPETDRTPAWVAIVALGIALQVAVLAALVFVWRIGLNDFSTEVDPAYRALFAGHVLQFLREAPQYVGSLVLRAPIAVLVNALGGTMRSVYFWTSLPFLAAAPALGVWLSLRPVAQARHRRAITHVSPLVLSAVNPIVILGILGGHPEEVLNAVLCVGAVVLAYDGRAGLAGLTVGLAVANKPWAIAAVPVVLAVLPVGRWRLLAWMLVPIGILVGPALVVRLSAVGPSGTATSLGSSAAGLLLPSTLLWWFGRGSWLVHNAHLIIVFVAAICSATWWLRHRRVSGDLAQGLLLLALVMLLRAALDPWDNLYYHLPFLFAVMAWESGRPARFSALLTVVTLIVVPSFIHLPAGTHAFVYLLFALSTAAWLTASAYGTPARGKINVLCRPPLRAQA